MILFLRRLFLFLIPVGVYIFIVLVFDPFNYFNFSTETVPIQLKRTISYKISNALYEMIEFEKRPSSYVLLGSSQTGLIQSDIIRQKTDKKFLNLSYGGGTLPEVITTFWEIDKHTKLKEVVIGISLIDYNGSQYRNRLPEALKIKSGLVNYMFSKATLKSTLLLGKSLIFNEKIEVGVPNMSENEFWKYQLDITAVRFYENHSYPAAYFVKLKEISSYCKRNNIILTFFIPPSHIDLQMKKSTFHMEMEDKKFKSDLIQLGDVYDFDFPNDFTRDRKNFTDPFHSSANASRLVVAELFSANKPGISKFTASERPDMANH